MPEDKPYSVTLANTLISILGNLLYQHQVIPATLSEIEDDIPELTIAFLDEKDNSVPRLKIRVVEEIEPPTV